MTTKNLLVLCTMHCHWRQTNDIYISCPCLSDAVWLPHTLSSSYFTINFTIYLKNNQMCCVNPNRIVAKVDISLCFCVHLLKIVHICSSRISYKLSRSVFISLFLISNICSCFFAPFSRLVFALTTLFSLSACILHIQSLSSVVSMCQLGNSQFFVLHILIIYTHIHQL